LHLKGQGLTHNLGAPVQLFIMGKEEWHTAQRWPLPEMEQKPLYLRSAGHANTYEGDGTLSWEAPAGSERSDTFTYDLRNPVRNPVSPIVALPDQIDWREIEKRRDVLVYTSNALEEGIEVVGLPKIVVRAATDCKDTDWSVRLIEVYPDDFAKEIAFGHLRGRFRESERNPTLLEPGKIHKYTIPLTPVGNYFKPGNRIRLEVMSSNFPWFDRNTNTGNAFGVDGPEDLRVTHQTIYHDSAHPSRLVLPTLPRQSR
jgi:putative CocE/NonD family hydrolase